jgi:hypothetical protein
MRIRTTAAVATAATAGMVLSGLFLPSAQAATAPSPRLTSSAVTATATGLEFDAGLSASTAVTGVQAYFSSQATGTVYGPVALSLASGDGTAGVWAAAPGFGEAVALPHDDYEISLVTTDADGAQHRTVDTFGVLDYRPTPDFPAVAFSPTSVGYGDETVTASGRATTYEPESGDAGSPWTAPLKLTLSLGASAPVTTEAAADGSFAVAVKAVDYGSAPTAVLQETHTDGSTSVTSTVSSQGITMASPLPTRVVLDRSSAADLTAGSLTAITGTVQYQAGGQWYPLAGAQVDGGTTDVTTGADGRFSDTGVRQQVQIDIENAGEDPNRNLLIEGGDGSSDGTAPGGLFAFQQSPDGRTGWTTLRWITLPKTQDFGLDLPVTDPHGYWRLYSPTKTGYAAAVSNTVHVFLWADQITGGRPDTTRIARGGTLSFSGTLWRQGYGPTWQACARQQMYLMFLPAGGRVWQMTTSSTLTNAKGQFLLQGRATGSGEWQVRYYAGPTSQSTDAAGPAVQVTVD